MKQTFFSLVSVFAFSTLVFARPTGSFSKDFPKRWVEISYDRRTGFHNRVGPCENGRTLRFSESTPGRWTLQETGTHESHDFEVKKIENLKSGYKLSLAANLSWEPKGKTKVLILKWHNRSQKILSQGIGSDLKIFYVPEGSEKKFKQVAVPAEGDEC